MLKSMPMNSSSWCARAGVPSIATVQPVHVAAWIEASLRELKAPSVKQRQRLAALRHLFDWLVVGQLPPHRSVADPDATLFPNSLW